MQQTPNPDAYGMYAPQINIPTMANMGNFSTNYQGMADPNNFYHSPYQHVKMEESFVNNNNNTIREETFSQPGVPKEEFQQKKSYSKGKSI